MPEETVVESNEVILASAHSQQSTIILNIIAKTSLKPGLLTGAEM